MMMQVQPTYYIEKPLQVTLQVQPSLLLVPPTTVINLLMEQSASRIITALKKPR
jgi:hypothetical protein